MVCGNDSGENAVYKAEYIENKLGESTYTKHIQIQICKNF
jgi:hypothetical protein